MKQMYSIGRVLILLTLCTGCLISTASAADMRENTVPVFSSQDLREVLTDELFQGTVVIGEDFEATETQDIVGPRERAVSLDLNGHTLTCSKNVDNAANLRLIDSTGGGTLMLGSDGLCNNGDLTIDGAVVMGEFGWTITNEWRGTFRLISGSISGERAPSILNNDGGICLLEGGTIINEGVAVDSSNGLELVPTEYSTDHRWHRGTLIINGGLIQGAIIARDTDITITGGTIRGKLGGLEYRNAAEEVVALPSPTYELHEEKGEMRRGYLDVTGDDWFSGQVWSLLNSGVLDYGEDGNFGPTALLTRAQAAALLARTCRLEVEEAPESSLFSDVDGNTPYGSYIRAAQKAGLVSGDGQGRFHPEGTVTRQEFAVLVRNAIRHIGKALPTKPVPTVFADLETIAPWAREAVLEGAQLGLWSGVGDDCFAPNRPISRAEGVTVLARLVGSKRQ